MNKKLALFVAWALLAAGVVVGSSTPASAIEGEPFPFGAQFGGYANGAALHVGALQSGGTRLADADLAFSGTSVNSSGLAAPVLNEYGMSIQPNPSPGLDDLTDQEAYGRGSGVEVGLGSTIPDDERDLILAGLAEAASAPAERSDGDPPATPTDSGRVEEQIDVPAEPLLFARAASGWARAQFDDNFCVTGAPVSPAQAPFAEPDEDDVMGFGRGFVAEAQLLETDGDPATDDMDFPVVQVRDPANPERNAVDSKSFTYLVPNGDPADPDTTYGIVSEVRQTYAPISVGPPDPITGEPPLTIEVLGEWVMRLHASGLGPATVFYGPMDVSPQTPVIRIHSGPPPAGTTTVLTTQDLFGDEGLDVGGILVVGEDPREIAQDATSAPDLDGDTEYSAAADVIRLSIPPVLPPADPFLADVRIGHFEVSATVPDGGINCPGSVEILKDFSEDATGNDFEFVVSCVDPDTGQTLDLVAGEPVDLTVIIPGTAPDGTPAPDASATAGPIPSGAECEVTENPPPGWRSTQTSADPPVIVTNQFSQVRFLNEPRPAEPNDVPVIVEKTVPADNVALQEITYTFRVECLTAASNPLDDDDTNDEAITNQPFRREIRPADDPPREDDPSTPAVQEFDPAFGDTRDSRTPGDGDTVDTDEPVVVPEDSWCRVIEDVDPLFDPNDPNSELRFIASHDDDDDPNTPNVLGETTPWRRVSGTEEVFRFHNDPPPPGTGFLVVIKDAPDDPDAQATEFSFRVSCLPVSNTAFDRRIVGDGESAPVVGIPEDTTCTVHEDRELGYEEQPDQQIVIDGNADGTQRNEVTFVNVRSANNGTLIVTNDAPDNAQDVEFDFSVDCPTAFADPIDIKITGDGSSDPIRVPAGTECTGHSFTEPGFASLPDITATVLPDPTVTELLFVQIPLGAGAGSLTVTKDAPADAQDVIFTFVIHCPSLFNEPFARSVVGDGVSEAVVGIPAGTLCTISEPTVNGFLPQADQQILIADGANNATFVNTRGGPVVGGVTFSRQPAAPAVAANTQPRYTG